ncbi:hypothetical protein M427DRAFT_55277 [Gonapodya prolifera JEL478]|uniref:Transmembrane protein n=1 Tax=Gonapodya prolifera (strain JEL478) TaxID=1344416 RepID=A0A139AJ85_GONPJ|nr:hypothetical protein M427DRAFT_55277 [Gonapodya prolifera JEL478]|eukprot:KXS16624.1 hypothetical protein M427DRAFT_55277 [Gonapodya prolifera JEL478]
MDSHYGSLRDHSLRSMRSVLAEGGGRRGSQSPVTTVGDYGTTAPRIKPSHTAEDDQEEIVMEDFRDDSTMGRSTTIGRRQLEQSDNNWRFWPAIVRLWRKKPRLWLRIGFWVAITQTLLMMILSGASLALNSRLIVRVTSAYDDTVTEDAKMSMEYSFLVLRLYEIIVFMAMIFQLNLFIRASEESNRTELLAAAAFMIIPFCFGAFHVVQQLQVFRRIARTLPDFKLGANYTVALFLAYALFVATCLFILIWAAIGTGVYGGLRWNLYKRVGADTRTRRRIGRRHILQLFTSIGTFFIFGFTLQFYFLALTGLAATLVPPFFLTLGGLMLLGGIFLFVFVARQMMKESSPALVALFGYGCMAEVLFCLYFANGLWVDVATDQSAAFQGSGIVTSLRVSAVITGSTFLVTGGFAVFITFDEMREKVINVGSRSISSSGSSSSISSLISHHSAG